MLTEEIVLTIPGRPMSKGSMKCIGRRGKIAHVLVESVNNTEWRDTVKTWTKRLTRARAGRLQPLGAEITFTIERPATHYGTGRNRNVLRHDAPAWPTGRGSGDVDKLLRLILDSLQDAELLPDDAQIVRAEASKTYPWTDDVIPGPDTPGDALPWPGVRIRLYPIGA